MSRQFSRQELVSSARICRVTDAYETRYARSSDGINLAYQVSGRGPLELVFLSGPFPIELLCEDPGFIRLRRRLEMFSRTVWVERRGVGASEGDLRESLPGNIFDGDLVAVLNAVGFEQPAVVAFAPSGSRAIHFSVTHPKRLSALVLVSTYAHYLREGDYPWGIPREDLDRFVAYRKETWGTGAFVELMAPSKIADGRFRAWYARLERLGGGPEQVAESHRAAYEADVRALLPAVSVPTLVLHREHDRMADLGAGRYLAEYIRDAHLVVLPGEDHLFFVGDVDALVDEIEEFLTGASTGAEADVVMAAVLFTDVVASTEQQARVGPRQWSRLTDQHDAMVRAALARHRGHEVKTIGDGFLATFDATGRALRCAADILAGAKDIGLNLRVGVHTGEVEVRGDDIAGLAVTIAKRVCDLAEPGHPLVSETVRGHMVGAGVQFQDRGEHELKGVPGTWRLYRIAP
jgi:class 3 adenylate cyclase/pimeloyl-ACP methyl ester carboxylesterase